MPSPKPRRFDVILAGGGAAGLSLAYHLYRTNPDLSMLIVDEAVKDVNDHTWCFWHRRPTYLDDLAFRAWDRLSVVDDAGKVTAHGLAPYHYTMVRSIDFYRFIRETFAGSPKIEFRHGTVAAIADGLDEAEVTVNEMTYTGSWVFDSRYRSTEYRPLSSRHTYLKQHFVGWEVETEGAAFDPELPRLFDFRTPQLGTMRFFYVLPYNERRGLVEYTLFSQQLLPLEQYRAALRDYIEGILGQHRYQVVEEERDIIPMTDHRSPRRNGRRILNIGTRGGRVKASSGYAFARIQRDAAAITRSLERRGHPFDLPEPPRRYGMFDAVLLHVLRQHGDWGKRVFLALFSRNPIQRIFRFLDEDAGVAENLQLMMTVPRLPFLQAWISTGPLHLGRRQAGRL